MNMKLHQLRYLIAVAEEGSMLKAARKIGIAQPALTQQLASLEGALDTKLLHRSSKGTRLTQGGRILVEHARSILEMVAVAQRDVQSQRNEVSGEVSLSVASAVAEQIVPPLLKRLSAAFPRVTLRINATDSGSVQTALENARVDLGILPDHENLKSVNSRPLLNQAMCFVGSTFQTGRKLKKTIAFRDVAGQPLVVVEKSNPLRQELDRLAKQHDITLNVHAESNSLVMIRSYVESGSANSILPQSAVADKVQLGTLFAQKIVEPQITQLYLVAWPKTRPLIRAGEVVVGELQQIIP